MAIFELRLLTRCQNQRLHRDLARFKCRLGPGAELPHVLEKGSTPPDVDTAFGLVLIRSAILDGSADLTYATLQSLMSTL